MTDLRCTAVSSCFGRHLRFITHRIYWYLLLRFCFVRHKTQMHVTAHNCSASAESTLQPASQSRPAAAGNAMHVWQIRAVRCRAAVEPEVRHPSHLSAGAMQQLHAACICTHVGHTWYDFSLFLRRDHDPATAAAVAVHRACNNRLQRYNATAPSSRQHHARDRA